MLCISSTTLNAGDIYENRELKESLSLNCLFFVSSVSSCDQVSNGASARKKIQKIVEIVVEVKKNLESYSSSENFSYRDLVQVLETIKCLS